MAEIIVCAKIKSEFFKLFLSDPEFVLQFAKFTAWLNVSTEQILWMSPGMQNSQHDQKLPKRNQYIYIFFFKSIQSEACKFMYKSTHMKTLVRIKRFVSQWFGAEIFLAVQVVKHQAALS